MRALNLSQTIFDLRAINASRAEDHYLAAAELNVKTARDLVVLVSANLYLQSLAAAARVQSAQAQLQTAQAIFDQATRLKESGIVAGIEVLRAEVQLGTDKQRVTAVENELQKTKLQLARVIGLPPGQAFTLSEDIPFAPFPEITLEQALERAYKSRPDYLAAQERVAAAESERSAAAGEWLPSLKVNADYGRIGLTPADSEATYSLAGVLSIPIFNGGRTKGRIIQADSDLRARQSELADLKAGIDYDIRSAFLDLNSSTEQLEVATRSRDLAGQQLTQARDRFAAESPATLKWFKRRRRSRPPASSTSGPSTASTSRRRCSPATLALRKTWPVSFSEAFANGRFDRDTILYQLGPVPRHRGRGDPPCRGCWSLVVVEPGQGIDRRCAGRCARDADCFTYWRHGAEGVG
jgi:outer membrane protein TolC